MMLARVALALEEVVSTRGTHAKRDAIFSLAPHARGA